MAFELPSELPAPLDDGGARHLEGMAVPSVRLAATSGETVDLAERCEELVVAYVYPRTGEPGKPLPFGWEDIPGARGCTPQSCAFRDALAEFEAHGAEVLGISAQPLAAQREFAAREHIPFVLLNDSGFRLAEELGLPTFQLDGERFYKRLTFVARGGRIAKVFYPVFPPDENAREVLGWLGGGV